MTAALRTRYLEQSEWLLPTNVNSVATENVSDALSDWLEQTGHPGDLFKFRQGFYYIPQGIRIGKPLRLDLNGSFLSAATFGGTPTDGSEWTPLYNDWNEAATWPLHRVMVSVQADDVTIFNSHATCARIAGAARAVNFTGGFTQLPRGCVYNSSLEGQHAIRIGGGSTNIKRTTIDLRNISLEFCHGDGVYINDNGANIRIIGVNNGVNTVGGRATLVSGIHYQTGQTGASISGTDWVPDSAGYPGIHHMGRHGLASDFTIDSVVVDGVSIWQIRRAIVDLEPAGVGDVQSNIELARLETGAKELLWLAAAGPRKITNLWVHDCVSYDWMSIDTANASATARHDTWLLENNRGAGVRHGVAWNLDRIDGLQILGNYQPVNTQGDGVAPGDSTSVTITPAEESQFPKGTETRIADGTGTANQPTVTH